jgi:hypothetical protein
MISILYEVKRNTLPLEGVLLYSGLEKGPRGID